MPAKNEDFERLFGEFVPKDEAQIASREVAEGLGLFLQYPAPEPDEDVLHRIQAEMSQALVRKRRAHAHRAVRYGAAVAAVIIAGLATFFFIPDHPPVKVVDLGAVWWEDSESSAVSVLAEEVDGIVDEMIRVSRQEYDFSDIVSDIEKIEIEEMEYVANSDDFWKG